MRRRQGEYLGPVLAHQGLLDLRLALSPVDQFLDEGPLAVGLGGLCDRQRDLAGDAHHLAFHRGQVCTRSGGMRGCRCWCQEEHRGECSQQTCPSARGFPHAPYFMRRPFHALCASFTARCRNSGLTCPREMATMSPLRSITKLSGSRSVPKVCAKSPLASRRLG